MQRSRAGTVRLLREHLDRQTVEARQGQNQAIVRSRKMELLAATAGRHAPDFECSRSLPLQPETLLRTGVATNISSIRGWNSGCATHRRARYRSLWHGRNTQPASRHLAAQPNLETTVGRLRCASFAGEPLREVLFCCMPAMFWSEQSCD